MMISQDLRVPIFSLYVELSASEACHQPWLAISCLLNRCVRAYYFVVIDYDINPVKHKTNIN
jgi:hypothetical protein